MLLKTKVLETFINNSIRFFKTNIFAKQTVNTVQYSSGGDDYSPLPGAEGITADIGNNPANSIVFAWKDDVTKKSAPGEKRIYSVFKQSDETVVKAEIHLKNTGEILISGAENLNITVLGNVNLNATNINSSGNWIHDGNFKANHIESVDGASGTYKNSVTAASGIVTGGS